MAEKKASKKIPSALKRHKQSEVARLRNKQQKSTIATLFKKVEKTPTPELVAQLHSRLDKAAKTKLFKPNKVARNKSQASKLLVAAK